MREPTSDTELAWAAGFFDGEGSTILESVGNGYKACRLTITQAGTEVLHRFGAAVGFGHLNDRSATPEKPHWKQQWAWNITTFEHVQMAVVLLWPWLTEPKKAQIRRVLLAFKDQPRIADGFAVRTFGKRKRDMSPDELLEYARVHQGNRRRLAAERRES